MGYKYYGGYRYFNKRKFNGWIMKDNSVNGYLFDTIAPTSKEALKKFSDEYKIRVSETCFKPVRFIIKSVEDTHPQDKQEVR